MHIYFVIETVSNSPASVDGILGWFANLRNSLSSIQHHKIVASEEG